MSDNTATSTPEAKELPQKDPTTKVLENGVTLKLESFDEGKFKGFQFWRPTFKDAKSAVDHFTKNSKGGKTGEEVVTGIVNSQLSARMRSQATQFFIAEARKINDDKDAKASDLTDEDIAKIRETTKGIIITEEDALEYVPGERDVDSLSGLRKQKEELKKMAKKLKDEGKIDLAKEKIAQYFELDKQIKAKEKEEENMLLDLLGAKEEVPA